MDTSTKPKGITSLKNGVLNTLFFNGDEVFIIFYYFGLGI